MNSINLKPTNRRLNYSCISWIVFLVIAMVLAAFDEKLALGTTQTFVFIIASYFAAKFGFYMAFWGMETGKQTPWEEE